MTPLDDELRTALGRRAEALAPAADPLAGIESRARRIQRRRGAAAALGTTLAVALVAVAVPTVLGSTTAGTDVQQLASPAPSSVTRPGNALDWAGARPVSATTEDPVGAVVRTWADEHDVDPAQVLGEELAAPVVTSDRSTTVVFLQLWAAADKAALTPESGASVVVGQHEAGLAPILARDSLADPEALVVEAVVAGKRQPDIAVALAPGVERLEYADGGAAFVEVELDGRSASFPRTLAAEGRDRVRATAGSKVDEHDVHVQGQPDGQDPGSSDGEPANLLADWPARGETPSTSLVADAKKGFALALGRLEDLDDVQYKVLFAGSTDGGLRYVLGQAWFAGETTAYPAAFYTGGEQGSEPFVGRPNPVGAKVLAFVPCCSPGLTVDELVVIPAPGAGQVQYAAANSEWRDVGQGQDHLDGVVIVDRDARDYDDRIRVLDGDGNTDGPVLYEGPVQTLLCGVRECG